jgi:hypothetical protein
MAGAKIHGAEYAIEKVFSDDFVFNIPLYQRPYAWTLEQAGELLSDLLAFMGEGVEPIDDLNPYFLGSIVLIKGDKPEADVVDGQQRLTTLTILLAAIRELVSQQFSEALTPFLYEKGNVVKGTPNRYRLTLRERDADFFRALIQDEGGSHKLKDVDPSQLTTDAQRNIRENALLFLEQLQGVAEQQRERLARFIITRCFLVVVSTPDLDSAYRIFSVLNDRGLDLSLTDILKAEIIGKIPVAEQPKYTDKWEVIEENLGRNAFQELFAHIRMIDRKAKVRDSMLKELRQYVAPQNKPKQFIDDTLQPLATALDEIKTASYTSAEDAAHVNRLFRWLNQIGNFDWLPPAIVYLSRHHHEPNKLVRFFTDLERLAAGLMIQRAYINNRLERYGRLLAAIELDVDLYSSDSPLQFALDERQKIINTLNGDLYLLKNIPRYVLLRLDEALSDGAASYDYPVISIEHVLPQSPPQNSIWMDWFPSAELQEKYMHRLGNLVLLSRRKNSSARNFDFKRKKSEYFTSGNGISPFVLTTQVLQEEIWTPEVVEKRQAKLMSILRNIWRL